MSRFQSSKLLLDVSVRLVAFDPSAFITPIRDREPALVLVASQDSNVIFPAAPWAPAAPPNAHVAVTADQISPNRPERKRPCFNFDFNDEP